tara:strand:+ start:39835 stop:40572 length:738 start_codon:yes stop_codon:yes gene_type:complete
MQTTQLKTSLIYSEATPEKELISSAALGNDEAFEIIMRRHNRLLFRTARSILNSDTEAEDALQEAYLRAWQALPNFRLEAKLSTWLVQIVVNEALGRLRRKSAQIIPLDTTINSSDPEVQALLTDKSDQQPERFAMRAQLRKIIEAHIEQLPDLYRTVFVLRAVEELTTQEVALALKMPEATVRIRYHRARSLLRASLANDIDLTLDDAFSFDGARCDRIVNAVLARGKSLHFPRKRGANDQGLT